MNIMNVNAPTHPPFSMCEQVLYNPTIEELIYKYKACESQTFKVPQWQTKINNINKFLIVLKAINIHPKDCTRMLGGTHPQSRLPIPEHYLLINKSSGSCIMRQAKSIFSKGMVRYYKQIGIDCSPFASWQALSLQGVNIKPFDACKKEEILLLEKCTALKNYDLKLYKCYLLAYGIGMRSSEILRAKYNDFWEDYDGNKLVRIYKPKSSKKIAYQDRPCDPKFWDEVVSLKTDDMDFIVPGSDDIVTREFPNFLHNECGVSDRRCVHKLRKYCGHRIMRTNNQNAFVAQRALGHSSVEMTSKVYIGLPKVRAT